MAKESNLEGQLNLVLNKVELMINDIDGPLSDKERGLVESLQKTLTFFLEIADGDYYDADDEDENREEYMTAEEWDIAHGFLERE